MVSKILIIDDDRIFRKSLRNFFENDGFAVADAEKPEQAYGLLSNDRFDIVLTDYLLGDGRTGFEILEHVREKQIPCLTLMMSGSGKSSVPEKAYGYGACGFWPKYGSEEALLKQCQQLMHKKQWQEEGGIKKFLARFL